jgi:hypothetical protein
MCAHVGNLHGGCRPRDGSREGRKEKKNRKRIGKSEDGIGVLSDNIRKVGSNLESWAGCIRH